MSLRRYVYHVRALLLLVVVVVVLVEMSVLLSVSFILCLNYYSPFFIYFLRIYI